MNVANGGADLEGRRHSQWIALFGITLLVACETSPSSDLNGPTASPEWTDPNQQPGPSSPADATVVVAPPTTQPSTQPLDVARPQPTSIPVEPPPVATAFRLRERFAPGAHIRRQVRTERRYRLEVQSDLIGSAEGASETSREYVVQIDEVLGGRIQAATINVLSDHRRVLTQGEVNPRISVELGPLHGARIRCQLGDGPAYRCDGRDLWQAHEMVGVYPQRILLMPEVPISVGQTWELSGAQADMFLGTPGGSASVQFLLEDDEAPFGDAECHHVVYTIGGTQPVMVLGTALVGSLSGEGEYFFCPRRSVVLWHRQERNVHVRGAVERGRQRTPVERSEDVVIEEETLPVR